MKILVADWYYKFYKEDFDNFVKNPEDIIVLNTYAFDVEMRTCSSHMFITDDRLPYYLETFKDYIIDKETL